MKTKTFLLPAITVFTGSFLLFLVQPMLGRIMLPWFGGTAATWLACLAAFQTLLMFGYFYTNWLSVKPLQMQRGIHLSILALGLLWSLAFLFLRPGLSSAISGWTDSATASTEMLRALALVLLTVGIPYLTLSSGSTMVQSWLMGRSDGNVYKLYAISNAGSLLGLLAYPFLLEPFFSISAQLAIFSGAFALYYALMIAIRASTTSADAGGSEIARATEAAKDHEAFAAAENPVQAEPSCQKPATASATRFRLVWFLLPAASVYLLNATTAYLTLDVAPLPLLWVMILVVYLLSYIVGFTDRAARMVKTLGFATLALVLAFGVFRMLNTNFGPQINFRITLAVSLLICFVGCLYLHSWYYSVRPNDGSTALTRYYLCNAVGGTVGGLLASVASPLIFSMVLEYPVSLVVLLALVLANSCAMPHGSAGERRAKFMFAATVGSLLAVVSIGLVIFTYMVRPYMDKSVVHRGRGFFGTVSVVERPAKVGDKDGVVHDFLHGSTVHGIQLRVPGYELMPTAYFAADAGGAAIVRHPKYVQGRPMRVGVVGMGMGVMLAYAHPGDTYVCYEISPEALNIATNPALFSFAANTKANVEIKVGDARKALEKERAAGEEKFDVIILDTFTGDNIPYHHSTKEAFALYFDRLQPDGTLALNISNWHLDLTPLVKAVGTELNVPVGAIFQGGNMALMRLSSMWAFFMPNPQPTFAVPKGASVLDFRQVRDMKLPTDEKGSYISLINLF